MTGHDTRTMRRQRPLRNRQCVVRAYTFSLPFEQRYTGTPKSRAKHDRRAVDAKFTRRLPAGQPKAALSGLEATPSRRWVTEHESRSTIRQGAIKRSPLSPPL